MKVIEIVIQIGRRIRCKMRRSNKLVMFNVETVDDGEVQFYSLILDMSLEVVCQVSLSDIGKAEVEVYFKFFG